MWERRASKIVRAKRIRPPFNARPTALIYLVLVQSRYKESLRKVNFLFLTAQCNLGVSSAFNKEFQKRGRERQQHKPMI